MPVEHVDSGSDPRLEPYRNLKQTNLTRWTGQFIAEGRKVVERLLASRYRVESVLLGEHRRSMLKELPVDPETLVLIVPEEFGTRLTGYSFHNGVLACGLRGETPSIDELWKGSAPPERSLLVACPQMTDPDNLGSLIRLCRAFGVDALLLGHGCCDPFSRRTLRVSMGNAFDLPIVECDDLAQSLDLLGSRWGYQLSGTILDPSATPLHQASPQSREVLLLGNEAHGLSPEWIARCDRLLTIPMHDQVDSLNVSIAAGICLHWLATADVR